MRQRVKLAQSLVADPELALLDEPTAGLDPTGREEMLALVARLATFGISVLLATHLLDDVARVCDHVVMLDGGRLVVAGPTETLLHQTGKFTVEVNAGIGRLARALTERGLTVVAGERRRRRRGGRHHRRRRGPRPRDRCSTRSATPWPTWACRCSACPPGRRRSTRRSLGGEL